MVLRPSGTRGGASGTNGAGPLFLSFGLLDGYNSLFCFYSRRFFEKQVSEALIRRMYSVFFINIAVTKCVFEQVSL